MKTVMDFLTQQNEWTVTVFLISILIDAISVYHVNKVVHNVKLYLVLISTIILNVIVNVAYLSQGALYNISPIISMITIILLCFVLVDIDKERQQVLQKQLTKERLKNSIITEQIYQSFTGTKKKLCNNHYTRIVTQNLEGACEDCPIVEQLNLNK